MSEYLINAEQLLIICDVFKIVLMIIMAVLIITIIIAMVWLIVELIKDYKYLKRKTEGKRKD